MKHTRLQHLHHLDYRYKDRRRNNYHHPYQHYHRHVNTHRPCSSSSSRSNQFLLKLFWLFCRPASFPNHCERLCNFPPLFPSPPLSTAPASLYHRSGTRPIATPMCTPCPPPMLPVPTPCPPRITEPSWAPRMVGPMAPANWRHCYQCAFYICLIAAPRIRNSTLSCKTLPLPSMHDSCLPF